MIEPIDRIARKTTYNPETGCWIWNGSIDLAGYGVFHVSGKHVKVHRWLFQHIFGNVGSLVLDHRCKNKPCCNPMHLEAVTRGVNTLRGPGPTSENAKKTHCKRGHPLSGENLFINSSGGRECKTCAKNRYLLKYPDGNKFRAERNAKAHKKRWVSLPEDARRAAIDRLKKSCQTTKGKRVAALQEFAKNAGIEYHRARALKAWQTRRETEAYQLNLPFWRNSKYNGPHANKSKKFCSSGHPLSGDNLKLEKRKNGTFVRRCRACANAAVQRCELKQKTKTAL